MFDGKYICSRDLWGKEFGEEEAQVVCKELGFERSRSYGK